MEGKVMRGFAIESRISDNSKVDGTSLEPFWSITSSAVTCRLGYLYYRDQSYLRSRLDLTKEKSLHTAAQFRRGISRFFHPSSISIFVILWVLLSVATTTYANTVNLASMP